MTSDPVAAVPVTTQLRTMMSDPLTAMVLLIAAGTVGAGLVQLVLPGVILDIIDGNDDSTAKHFFAIIGMFMTLFGALTITSLWVGQGRRLVLGFAAAQKLGASIAVGLGVVTDVFGPLALLIAGFDLVSFVLIALLSRRSPP